MESIERLCLLACLVIAGCIAIERFPLFSQMFMGGVINVVGVSDGFEAQRLPAGYGAEVFGERFGVFDGVDYYRVGMLAAQAARVRGVGHKPVTIFLAQIGIETALGIFDIVTKFQCRSHITN